MTPANVIDLTREVMITTFWVSLPLLAAGFVIGVAISLLQILTAIQDSSFTAVPRLAAFLGALLLAMPWMLAKITGYTAALLGDLGRFAR